MNKILVTGHLGFIGTNFTKLLDSQNIHWIGIDRKSGEDLLSNIEPFTQKVADCDIVVHLAATPRIPLSWESPDHYRDNNIGVTDRIARICAEQGKYLIFASSSSVYGDGDGPLNPYAWTKVAGEESIKMLARSLGLKYTIARIFTNYSEHDSSGLVISKWLDNYKNNKPLVLRETGKQSRDFIHVTDTCRALLAMCSARPENLCLDIGTGISIKLKDIVELFDVDYITEPELLGYAKSTCADIEFTQLHLNWEPKINLLNWIKEQIKD